MEFWKDADEAMNTILKYQQEVIKDPEIGPALQKLNQLIVYDYSENKPGCKVWMNSRDGKLEVGSGDPPAGLGEPNLVLSCSVDDAHRAWSNKLNVVVAITRKKVRIKGSAVGLLKLVPKQKRTAEIYNKVLTDLGMTDKIIK